MRSLGISGWVIVSSVILVAVFTALVGSLGPEDELWQWFGQIVSTLVAAAFAIVFGLYLFRQETERNEEQARKSRDETVYRLHRAIYQELGGILDRVDPHRSTTLKPLSLRLSDGRTATAYPGREETILLEEAARSGLLRPKDTEAFLNAASKIRRYSEASSEYLALVRQAAQFGENRFVQQDVFVHLAEKVEDARTEMTEFCIDLRAHLSRWFDNNEHARPPDVPPGTSTQYSPLEVYPG